MEKLHQLNILMHVIAGSGALIIGMIAFLTRKKAAKHRRYGTIFTWLMIIIVVTAMAGVIIFGRNTFLLVLTLLSGYNCFSGIRTMRLRGQKPRFLDYIVPIIVISSAVYYLYYINSIGLYWSPAVIYPTLGALFLLTIYDLCRGWMPVRFLQQSFIYEHVYKMLASYMAAVSAFSGTVFPQFKPYSQILPTFLGLLWIMIIFGSLRNKNAAKRIVS
ncbi:hypothetical protein CLV59_11516 [Chitinophaga dinghuensis]|uniref:Uncharacterized protein n=1 Tax=Chitinophaga dinghuensis TaxID=1539050 RepID=A0A327VKC4_9BACT|nr:hypothetical protein [Chitinophaga dinghuensis]RAJ72792.1 hypothetical protein CLV59_11516 [Chitinophaga dinghuensis]